MNKIIYLNLGCTIEFEDAQGKEHKVQVTTLFPSHANRNPEQALQELVNFINDVVGTRLILCQDTELEDLYALKLDAVSK